MVLIKTMGRKTPKVFLYLEMSAAVQSFKKIKRLGVVWVGLLGYYLFGFE